MSTEDYLRVSLTQFGDIVSFSLLSTAPEEDLWGCSKVRWPNMQFISKSKVHDPMLTLFQVEPFVVGNEDQAVTGKRGTLIKPGTHFKLFHLLTNSYVDYTTTEMALQAKLSDSASYPLAFSVFTRRVGVEEGVKVGDAVSLIAQPDDNPFSLCQDFWFKGAHANQFKITRFERFSDAGNNRVRYGRVCRLRSDTKMYLSVQPNTKNSGSLLLSEEEQDPNFQEKRENMRFPEYLGELKADLTNDAKDGNNYWVLERADRFSGDAMEMGDEMYLRHVASNRYLKGDLTLVQAAEKEIFRFKSVQQSTGPISFGEFSNLTSGESNIVSLEFTPSVDSIKTQLFQNVLSDMDPKIVLRNALSGSSAESLRDTLTFEVQLVVPEQANTVVELSQYLELLSEVRVATQNISKLQDAKSTLHTIDIRMSLNPLNLSKIEEEFAANVASDMQIVNELLRLWILKTHLGDAHAETFKGASMFGVLLTRLQNIQFYERVSKNLFGNMVMLKAFMSVAPLTLADILQWTLKANPPTETERMYWADAYLNASFQPTFDYYTKTNFFLHYLLDRLYGKMDLKNVDFLKQNSEYILNFSRDDQSFQVTTLGKKVSLKDLLTGNRGFAATTIEMAAHMCAHSSFTKEIIQGLGLDLSSALSLYRSTGQVIRLQMSFIFFIAEVHVPTFITTVPLTQITESHLQNWDLLNVSEPPELKTEWFYFPERNSPAAELIKEEVYFWLSTVHVPITCDDPTTWFYNAVVHFRLVAQLIECCTVSDMFVASMVSCAVALTKWVLETEVPGFSERFPNLKQSKYRVETEKQRVVEEFFELLKVYQRWKQVKVLRKCCKAGVTNVTAETFRPYLAEVQFENIFKEFCSGNAISITEAPDSQALLSEDRSSIPALVRSIRTLISNPELNVESILMHIVQNTHYTCKGDPSNLLNLIDNEINFSNSLLHFFSRVADVRPFQSFLGYIEAIKAQKISTWELENLPSTEVRHLPELVLALSTLADFMLDFKNYKEDFSHFQDVLRAAGFLEELERIWNCCAAVGTDHSEDQLNVELRTLTIELSRLYIHENDEHRKELMRILPVNAFYLDYPQFLSLLLELHLLDSGGDVYGNMAQVIFHSAIVTDKKRYLLAMKELLRNKQTLSKTIFTIAKYYETVEKEELTSCEWEMLIIASQAVRPEERLQWLSKVTDRWYEKSPNNIRREGAAVMIYAGDTRPKLFHNSLQRSVNHLEQVNTRDVSNILENFAPLIESPKTIRARNYEVTDSDVRYILELQFEKDSGVIYQIPRWMPKITLQNITTELAKFFLLISTEEALRVPAQALHPILSNYINTTDDKLTDETRALLTQVAAANIIPDTPVEQEHMNIPQLQPIAVLSDPVQPTRPLINKLFTAGQVITPDIFLKLKDLFLSKLAEREYLDACEEAANRTTAEMFAGKEINLIPVAEELMELTIDHKNKKMKQLALKILSILVANVLDFRPHFLKMLQLRRRYLWFFGLFEACYRDRRELQKRLKKESDDQASSRVILLEHLQETNGIILAFLSLFQHCCDGCYQPFQDYFRDQGEGSQSSINIVLIASNLLSTTLQVLSSVEESQVITQCGATLLEVVSGPCLDNQDVVCKSHEFLDVVMRVVKQANEKPEPSLEVLKSLVTLMVALVEGRERNYSALKLLMGQIDFSEFHKLSLTYANTISKKQLQDLELEINSDDAVLNRYNLAVRCMELCFSTMPEESLLVFRNHPLLKHVASVEIETVNPKTGEPEIRSLSFKVPFKARFLTGQTALQLLFEINRESRQVKLDDFTSKVPVCEVEMVHQQSLSRWSGLEAFTRYWKYYWFASFSMVVLINFLLLFCVEVSEEARFNIDSEWLPLLRVCSVVQLFFIVSGTVSFYVEYIHVLWTPLKTREESTEMEELPNIKTPGSLSTYFSESHSVPEKRIDIDQVMKLCLRCGYAVIACLAVFFPFLYPFLLLQIVNLNDSVVNILRSVTQRGSQLLLTLVFALMAIFIFTFIAYFFFYEYYSPDVGLYCDTLKACFLSTVNLGMRSGGGIGDAFGPTHENDFGFRLIFDLLFYICITTVLMAIVFGLIVDTFSELRDNRNATEFDMNNICFICGLQRSLIELKGEGWKKHTMLVHNPFSYLYFLLHLKETEVLDCSGIEKMVKECMENKDISYYPTTSAQIGFREVKEE